MHGQRFRTNSEICFSFVLTINFSDKFCNLGDSGLEHVLFIFLYFLYLSSLRFLFLFFFHFTAIIRLRERSTRSFSQCSCSYGHGSADWCRKNGRECLVGAGESFCYWIGSLFFYERLNCSIPSFLETE